VKTPKTLEILLTKWIKKNPGDYLFSDYAGKKLTSAGISKILNSIFKKNISVNMLRHAYITDTLGPKIADLEEKAAEMGQSTGQQKLYVKKDKE
jgi:site-specific recombinase XerD